MCVGEKAIYNWIVRFLPDNRENPIRLSGYVPEIFIFILHCESFLQRFMYWYHIFKDYMRTNISQNKVALDSANIYFDFLDSLLGFCLLYVCFFSKITFDCRNFNIAALFWRRSSASWTPSCKTIQSFLGQLLSRTFQEVSGSTDASLAISQAGINKCLPMREDLAAILLALIGLCPINLILMEDWLAWLSEPTKKKERKT